MRVAYCQIFFLTISVCSQRQVHKLSIHDILNSSILQLPNWSAKSLSRRQKNGTQREVWWGEEAGKEKFYHTLWTYFQEIQTSSCNYGKIALLYHLQVPTCFVFILSTIFTMNAGPVQTSRSAEPSCDQKPCAPQMVYIWVVGLSSQLAYLRHLCCDSHIICPGCAQSSISYMYAKCSPFSVCCKCNLLINSKEQAEPSACGDNG